ncbi:MAG: thiol oxidoreductase [Bdellovibrionales bacterium]|nr:thiol oxidoreductase [Bdellovibrionales bacterium]
MKKHWLYILVLASLVGCDSKKAAHVVPEHPLDPVDFESVTDLGGSATSKNAEPTSHGFRFPAPGLTSEELELHLKGDADFEANFSDDPHRPEFGLGPVFNNTSCMACHNRDGRGSLPVGLRDDRWTRLHQNEAIFLRISIENEEILSRLPSEENKYNAPVAVPGFSTQLFHLGSYSLREDIPGVGQAEVWMKLEKSFFTYPDGSKVELIKPLFDIRNPYDQTLDPSGNWISRLWESDVRTSPRMGMPMFGLGLLEAIPEEEILKQSQIDYSKEGVSGTVNYVFDVEKYQKGLSPARSVGRFGLKANTPSVLHQSLGALNGDIGVTNTFFPDESIKDTPLYSDYQSKNPNHKAIQAEDSVAEGLVFYSKTLAVPSRRNADSPQVTRGARLFQQARCTTCHRPSFKTGPSDVKTLSHQVIFPFTDMLLHDMGEGLADGRQDFLANGRQWRTRPLWGIGLTQVVNPRAGFLHDGRARTLEEAILWHDGEGKFSRDKFANLPKKDREALLQFLKSL